MNILVYGAGAIGSVFGGFLSRDHKVTLLGRKPHLEAIRKKGLRVSGIWGRHAFRNLKLETNARHLIKAKSKFDLILVTVKSYDTREAARAIRKMLSPKTLVISLQNGLGNVEALRRELPRSQVLAGRVIFGVELDRPGRVCVTVMAAPTAVGETYRNQITARVKRIAKIFDDAGIPSVPSANVQSLLWAKVIYNAALNPLATLVGCHYGFLTEHVLTRRVMDEVIEEVYRVACKMRIRLPQRTPEEYRKLFYSKLVPRTYNHHPSMLQDIRKGKRTEIDAMNGAILRLGRKGAIPTPVNQLLVKWIRHLEKCGQ